MKLSKIQKKLDPQMLQIGRKLAWKYFFPSFIWIFISIVPFVYFIEMEAMEQYGFGTIYTIFLIFVFGPTLFGLYKYFNDVRSKYFHRIANSLHINVYAHRPFSKEEIKFISKNFNKVKWSASLNVVQNIKDEADIKELQDKTLDKDYKYVEEFTELDDMQMKRLQTMYYIIIAVSGVIIYSFA